MDIQDLIIELDDDEKRQILYDEDFHKKHELDNNDLMKIINSLKKKSKEELLFDKELIVDKLHLDHKQITELAKELPTDEEKNKIISDYGLEKFYEYCIIKTFSVESKIKKVLEDDELDRYQKISILSTLNPEEICNFLRENREFCLSNDIRPYEIVTELNSNDQKIFIENFEDVGLEINEKREILVRLHEDVKQTINIENLPEEYKTAISMKTNEIGVIIINLGSDRNLEDYRGLDNLISVNAEKFTEEEKLKFMKLCDICPNLRVKNSLKSMIEFYSTGLEYKEAEMWISSVMETLKPEFSKAQKVAIIDNAIGKKISYSPDFGTEVFDDSDSRALWKIISSGYGVCNGIARVEQYMLDRAGIDSELVESDTHTFLKLKDIELPFANGEFKRGTTILDPTWNLASHRFKGKPNNFCLSYEEIRRHDIDSNGKDHNCHKNDKELQDATMNLDEQSLRMLFSSVGLADKDGQFPIKDLIDESKSIDKIYANDPKENIKEQFLLLSKTCPEFARCQDSSMEVLKDVFLDNENLKFDKCVVNRVYEKSDKQKRPIMYVYIASEELGKKFYYADKERDELIEIKQEEFEKRFECYDRDLEKADGIRPWEDDKEQKENINLENSSGKLVAEEGEER